MVVLDTNVLVSALLNSFGPPGRVLDLVLSGELTVAYDDRVLAEWRQVLHREKFGFSASDVEVLLDFVEGDGISVNASPLAIELPDPDGRGPGSGILPRRVDLEGTGTGMMELARVHR